MNDINSTEKVNRENRAHWNAIVESFSSLTERRTSALCLSPEIL